MGKEAKRMTNLRRAVVASGLKPIEVAERRGVNPSVLTRHMQAGVRTIRVARKYAKALGCDPFDLLD